MSDFSGLGCIGMRCYMYGHYIIHCYVCSNISDMNQWISFILDVVINHHRGFMPIKYILAYAYFVITVVYFCDISHMTRYLGILTYMRGLSKSSNMTRYLGILTYIRGCSKSSNMARYLGILTAVWCGCSYHRMVVAWPIGHPHIPHQHSRR